MQSASLESLIDLEKFQKIQDDIALATGLAVILVDYKGNPLTRHSRCSAFCKRIRENNELNKLCEKCDSRGGLEAARFQGAYIYHCHVGIVDFAVPIIIGDQYVGALMAGQVRTETTPVNEGGKLNSAESSQPIDEMEMIVSSKYHLNFDKHRELKPYYDKLPVMSKVRIGAIARMMQYMIDFIVEEAILTHELYEGVEDVQLYYAKAQIKEENVLEPALKFIKENPGKKFYLDDMAKRCNVSASYFSRIFKRKTGENFTTFVNHVKMKRAVEMLLNTNEPIINISLELGYDDCGYFIKLFKKEYGMTPAAYRKVSREKTQKG